MGPDSSCIFSHNAVTFVLLPIITFGKYFKNEATNSEFHLNTFLGKHLMVDMSLRGKAHNVDKSSPLAAAPQYDALARLDEVFVLPVTLREALQKVKNAKASSRQPDGGLDIQKSTTGLEAEIALAVARIPKLQPYLQADHVKDAVTSAAKAIIKSIESASRVNSTLTSAGRALYEKCDEFYAETTPEMRSALLSAYISQFPSHAVEFSTAVLIAARLRFEELPMTPENYKRMGLTQL